MRLTFNSQYRDGSAAIEAAAERLMEAQKRVSSGRRLARISDDPTAAATSVAERNKLAGIDQYTRAADSVSSRLAVVDTVLTDLVAKLTQAQVTVSSVRGSSPTAQQRESAGQQFAGLRDSLLDSLNTSFNGSYLFSGTTSTTRPYAAPAPGAVPVYQGANSAVQVDVGEGRAISVAFDGQAITQGSDTQDLFQTLDDLMTAVTAGDDAGMATGLDALQRAFNRAVAAQTRLGSDLQSLDSQRTRLLQMQQSAGERLSKLEDVNMAEAITEMTHADATYRAALGAVGTMSRVSLLDYLK